jgi:hypothetical protein
MSRLGPIRDRLVALFIFGAVLFNPPFLSIFNRPDHLLGVPLLYLYLFLAWVLLIALTGLLVERAEEGVEARHASDQPDDAKGTDD